MSTKNTIIAAVILILHLVGAIGTIYPETRPLFIKLTPVNLVISVALLLTGHRGGWDRLTIFFIIAFLTGFLVEVLGVQTGFPFGEYWYGNALGLKVAGVPLVIGLNWFMLTYLFGVLYNFLKISNSLKIILAALSMVLLDILIEPVAVKLDYWHWEGQNIPLTNYLGWFFVSIFVQFCFKKMSINQTNRLVFSLIISQIAYFILVYIFVVI